MGKLNVLCWLEVSIEPVAHRPVLPYPWISPFLGGSQLRGQKRSPSP